MKKAEVKIGETYAVKVSGQIAPVVIDEVHPAGGWVGTNQETNRQVRVKSAQRLRGLWDDYLAGGDEPHDRPALVKPEDKAALDGLAAGVLGGTEAAGGAKGEDKPERKPKGAKAEKRATRANGGDEGGKPTTPQATKAPMSGLDAAAKVLEEADEPLSCKAIVERAFAAGYWRSDGKTPHATVYSAILREMQKKGDDARFRKVARGKFELAT